MICGEGIIWPQSNFTSHTGLQGNRGVTVEKKLRLGKARGGALQLTAGFYRLTNLMYLLGSESSTWTEEGGGEEGLPLEPEMTFQLSCGRVG